MRGREAAQRRVGIIGVGRIARAVIAAIDAGEAGSWQLCGLLGRSGGVRGGLPLPVCTDMESFAATRPDLIVEMGGPAALAQHGTAALAVADTWSISGMALQDAAVAAGIDAAGRASGHRLRLLAGAIGGLDAIAALAVDPQARVSIDAGNVAGRKGQPLFEGSAAEAVARFHGLNVVSAAAVAGIGLERTRVIYDEREASGRLFRIEAESEYGRFSIACAPRTTPEHGTRTVAASVVAALRQADRTVWAG